MFFLNVPPQPCPDSDETFYDDDGYGLNALFMRIGTELRGGRS